VRPARRVAVERGRVGELRQERASVRLQVGVEQREGLALQLAVALGGARHEGDALGRGSFQCVRDEVSDLAIAFGGQSLVGRA
jgi:hypothetical protein